MRDRVRDRASALTGGSLWIVILVPILAISWMGFYGIARAVGVPPVFAAGMSAAFDGVALYAARIGLRHRRKGYSGYLARITVIVFAGLGAFVQSFHGRSETWIHAHSWIVWAVAPVAACLAYELHLGWVHRKQLIRMGYVHPSAKSGFGPLTWFRFPRETWQAHSDVLRARRAFIADGNLKRFALEEEAQPVPTPCKARTPKVPKPVELHVVPPADRRPKTKPVSKPPARPRTRATQGKSKNQVIADWWVAQGGKLGYNNRVPIEGLRAYRAAHAA